LEVIGLSFCSNKVFKLYCIVMMDEIALKCLNGYHVFRHIDSRETFCGARTVETLNNSHVPSMCLKCI
jgi:hypothetical protein